MADASPLGMDMITKKPRTPRDPYTTLTDKQIKNIPQDTGAFFMFSKPDRPYPDKGWYRDRYATSTNQHLFRGPTATHPHCWVDTQWQRDPPELHNTARLGGAERWGPDKVGARTIQHFNRSEDPKRFVNIDLYRRAPTNMSGPIYMDYGRPVQGYYSQRNPNESTWFGSTVPLNRTTILENIRPKTRAEYEQMHDQKCREVRQRKNMFPAYSEYTDRMLLRTKMEPSMTTLQNRKRYLEEAAT